MTKRSPTNYLLAVIAVGVFLCLFYSIRTYSQVRDTDMNVHDAIGDVNTVLEEVRGY